MSEQMTSEYWAVVEDGATVCLDMIYETESEAVRELDQLKEGEWVGALHMSLKRIRIEVLEDKP